MASELGQNKIKRDLIRCNLLIIDDWMLSKIDEAETDILYEIIHDREISERTATMLCTQNDLKGCAMKRAGQTVSDAIFDRLEHNTYVIKAPRHGGHLPADYGRSQDAVVKLY